MSNYKILYQVPLPSERTGALFNSFSYPTKISPEAIGVFIACHTEVGNTVLDPFAGSGTTGLAAALCDKPTEQMKATAKKLGVEPKWGPRNAVLHELSTLGSFIAKVMCNPPDPTAFEKEAKRILEKVEKEVGYIYSAVDNEGNLGTIRHILWSDVLICATCNQESYFWEVAVSESPLAISSEFTCPNCSCKSEVSEAERATEVFFDQVLKKHSKRKKRVPVKVYGKTGKKTWSRHVSEKDLDLLKRISEVSLPDVVPVQRVNWGDLYRSGYHSGISHIHHFYTERNLLAFAKIWEEVNHASEDLIDALKLLVLSYNASHSTLMSRVVVKKNSKEFVLTGAQSGVLYISSLPVEKNIIEGVKRKITTIKNAFSLISGSKSVIQVNNASSTNILLSERSTDYIFTDPPFGDYIPYAEINQVNEAWLGKVTDQKDEVIVSSAQKKGVSEYTSLMSRVFKEASRVLKDDGKITVVFHSAKAAIWQSLMDAYTSAGLHVETSSVLDKVQGSFKQVSSNITVKGDPLILLSKKHNEKGATTLHNGQEVIEELLNKLKDLDKDSDEHTLKRLYSRYTAKCLEAGLAVEMNADDFYNHVTKIREVSVELEK